MLALTGMQRTHKVDLAEFQSIHQEAIFHAAGVSDSSVVMNADAIPGMLRNHIAAAVSDRTCVHLAIPVDLQLQHLASPAAWGSMDQLQDKIVSAGLQAEAPVLPSRERCRRVAVRLKDPAVRCVIAVGHTAASSSGCGEAIKALSTSLNAPVIVQLDAKGIIDEAFPLYYGVLGIFGNPGMEAARRLVASADYVSAPLILIAAALPPTLPSSFPPARTLTVIYKYAAHKDV